jgi:hypothetical protein
MFGGTAALLVALFLLWQSTRSQDAPIVAQPSEPTAQPAPAPSESATTPTSPTAARTPRAPTSGSVAGPRPAPSMPAGAPSTADSAPLQLTNENLELGGAQLRAQTKAVEPLVRECVEKAAKDGVRPSGTAMLTYIVAKRGNKLSIEDTGIDNEKTTIENEPLLQCLHQTAKSMQFVGLPRGASEIYAARSVTLENGKVTEYKHVTFSYLR